MFPGTLLVVALYAASYLENCECFARFQWTNPKRRFGCTSSELLTLVSGDPSDSFPSSLVSGSGSDECKNLEHPFTDSLSAFEDDVRNVLRVLRPSTYDPTVPVWFRRTRLSFSSYWGLGEWERHSSRKRLIRYIISFPGSRLVSRCLPQLGALLGWSIVALLLSDKEAMLQVPLTSLSLVSTFVAGLLTLRTNQGLSRLKDARSAMGGMVRYTRETALLCSAYIMHRDRRLGLKTARLLALFGWSVLLHLREINSDDVIRCLLQPMDASYVLYHRKRPIAILFRLRQIMENLQSRGLLGTTEHRLIEDCLRQLNGVVMEGERMRASPIPPVYAAHAGRLMVFYLLSLPYALIGVGLDWLAVIGLTLIVGFAMLGLDEMSHLFEQPFKFMPLHQLSKVSTIDVADCYCRSPPSLDENDFNRSYIEKAPSYWATQDMSPTLPYEKPSPVEQNIQKSRPPSEPF